MATKTGLGCLDCAKTLRAARAAQIKTWVHGGRDDGRWFVARWVETAAQWQWTERPTPAGFGGSSGQYAFSCSRSRNGVTRHYASRAGAIASLRQPDPSCHRCDGCEARERAVLDAEEQAAWERDRPRREAQERANAIETQRRHEAEAAVLEARDRREAESLARAQAEIDAKIAAALERHREAFWRTVQTGESLRAAKDLSIVAVDRAAQRLTAENVLGEQREYRVGFSETTGQPHLFRA